MNSYEMGYRRAMKVAGLMTKLPELSHLHAASALGAVGTTGILLDTGGFAPWNDARTVANDLRNISNDALGTDLENESNYRRWMM
jgi:hypothetical protein